MADISRPNFARGRKLRWWRHEPRQPRRHRAAAQVDWQLWRLIFTVGGLMLGALALWIKDTDALRFPDVSLDARIDVIDGDTVRNGEHVYRLVGYNTPESGDNAGCRRERVLAAEATSRLRHLVANGESALERVACACEPGAEGTQDCNYGRRCGRLKVDGRDVGRILIAEGLAERYECWQTSCPRRKDWCAS
jgi:endonuclease YncB( thermonuclease family)